jgi:hypothetical protein
MRVPSLYHFFRHQLQHGLGKSGFAEPATVDYVSDILTRFAHTRALYALRNSDGMPLEYIADMLSEWYRAQGIELTPPDRSRQAAVIRHIGEYSLFMSGLFRERLKARGELNYYTAHGSNAFWHCADYEPNLQRKRLFRGLYLNFSYITDTLDYIRRFQLPYPATSTVTASTLLAAVWRT